MRKLISILVAQFLFLYAVSQYWQQQVNYTIDVSLYDNENTLDAFEQLEYFNNSPDTLRFIWFHVWPNAYKNDKTAYTDQSLENGNTKFYFSIQEERGYINRLEFKVNDQVATIEDHPQHIDIIKLLLPEPLLPKQKILITTPFHVKLPYNFNRGGYNGQNYTITHWYPKPAVYDQYGWHPMPMLEQGEFYSEFGNYNVRITLPSNYVVAATGELQETGERSWLVQRSNYKWEPGTEKIISKGVAKTVKQKFPPSSTTVKTLTFIQENVHDFAWFADKRYIVKQDTISLASGKIVNAFSYYISENEGWQNSIDYIKKAIHSKSRLVGEYPYNTVSVVQSTEGTGSGIEYPTITTLDASPENLLVYIINHEVGHNWFYGILGSNERIYPWMDEGINSYYDARFAEEMPSSGVLNDKKFEPLRIENAEDLLLKTKMAIRKDQAFGLPAEEYGNLNYDLFVYRKTAIWFELLEQKVGRELFDKAMQQYFSEYRFKHPGPKDFRRIMEATSGQDLSEEFSLIDKTGPFPDKQTMGTKVVFPFSINSVVSYIKETPRNVLLISPVVGANKYDKIMLGAVLTNYKLPPSRFQFLVAPMYSTGAKKINGIGKLNFTAYPSKGFLRKVDLFLNGSTFSMNEFSKDDGDKEKASFEKIVPGARFTFKEKSLRSYRNSYIQWKTFFINEDAFRISYDSVFTGTDTIVQQQVGTVSENSTLHQLKFVIEDFRALYPYKGELNLEHGKDFIRTAFTGNYFFNYAKEGGLNVRLFAGKFFYLGSKTFSKQFSTERYHLNMTGPDGYEDYTYSDFFIGRNKFESLPSQQIMVRDGGFKVRTDLYADKVGKTDGWLSAVNLTTSIPSGLNPLSILPFDVPLKIFADIGTYSDAWKKDAGLDRFIFDAGLQLSISNNLVNIYIPVIYSRIYKDYIQTVIEKKGRFWKTISFSIDISNFSLRKINREIDF